tara:strand:- start:111 stop:830 length:720 start_codon:yes stop_codon:yes gene_type:complete
MAASHKIKWQRALNELRYLNEELELVRQIVKDVGPQFEQYYREFCIRNNIDRDKLNREHAQRIQEAYGVSPLEEEAPILAELSSSIEPATMVHLPVASSFEEVTEDELSPEDKRERKELYEVFNKLFRKIALILHPDKLSKELSKEERLKRREHFNNAREALDKENYIILLDIAQQYNISIPRNYTKQTAWMKKQISKIQDEIRVTHTTYNYLFADATTDEQRDTVIRDFMIQLFGIKI